MARRLLQRVAALAAGICIVLAGLAQQNPAPKPYRDSRGTPLAYNGPGRDDPDPVGLSEVRIGYFGPADGSDPDGGQMWQGASMAIEEANLQGGYRGLPFRLVPAWSENPWAGGVANLVRITYTDGVWAILGGIDGATTHLAEQVVAKAQVVLVDPAATDRSIHSAGVPWMFSCAPGDHLLTAVISRELRNLAKSFVLVSAIDHDSRAFEAQLESALAHDQLVPLLHLECARGAENPARIARDAVRAAPEAVVVTAPARESADLVRALREAGFRGTLLSAPWIARATAETSIEGVLYPAFGDVSPEFRAKFRARWGRRPDYTAAYAYDAANIVAAAIRKAGLNRPRVREAVRALSPYHGVTGTIEWDPQGQSQAAPKLRAIGPARKVE